MRRAGTRSSSQVRSAAGAHATSHGRGDRRRRRVLQSKRQAAGASSAATVPATALQDAPPPAKRLSLDAAHVAPIPSSRRLCVCVMMRPSFASCLAGRRGSSRPATRKSLPAAAPHQLSPCCAAAPSVVGLACGTEAAPRCAAGVRGGRGARAAGGRRGIIISVLRAPSFWHHPPNIHVFSILLRP